MRVRGAARLTDAVQTMRIRRDPALAVPCPACGAFRGWWCTDNDLGLTCPAHPARNDAAGVHEQPQLVVQAVPAFDTGIGKAAGYADDAELIREARKDRETVEAYLTPEGVRRLREAERALDDLVMGVPADLKDGMRPKGGA